jgi:hypothetical protein
MAWVLEANPVMEPPVCTRALADIGESGLAALTVADHVCLRHCDLANSRNWPSFSLLLDQATRRSALGLQLLFTPSLQATDLKPTLFNMGRFPAQLRFASCLSLFPGGSYL